MNGCLAKFQTLRSLALAMVVAACSAGANDAASTESSSISGQGPFQLWTSSSPTRSAPVPLNGARLSGVAYIFTSDLSSGTAHPAGISQSSFWLDNPQMTGAPTHTEHYGPYDFAGSTGNTSGALALPWDVSKLPAGSHTIAQLVTTTTGAVLTAAATFSVGAAVADAGSPSTPPPTDAGTVPPFAPIFYAASSFINTLLPSSPSVDPNSAAMVASSIGAQASAAHLSNGDYGNGLVYSRSTDKVYRVTCNTYSSNTCVVGGSPGYIDFPIPAGATPPAGTDHNTAFVYTANDGSPYAGMELDCWIAKHDAATDTWSCGTASIVQNANGSGTCASGAIHCNGGTASGLDFAAGAIRPEEIGAGYIPHALAVAISNPGKGIVCPATHTDGNGTGIPEGGHFFLPSSFNVDAQSWPSWVKIVAHALQNYGAYIVDYGGSFEIKGFTDKNAGTVSWTSVGVPLDQGADLAMIPWNQMHVVTMTSCN